MMADAAEQVHGIAVGATVRFEKTISAADVERFAEVSGDDQPLHRDAAFAARTRFRQPIAHGMLCASLISAAIGTRLAPGLVVIYVSQSLRFRAPVLPGERLTATVTCTALDVARSRLTLETVVSNAAGTNVIAGEAVVLIEEPAPAGA